jgi:hypothetical protein
VHREMIYLTILVLSVNVSSNFAYVISRKMGNIIGKSIQVTSNFNSTCNYRSAT